MRDLLGTVMKPSELLPPNEVVGAFYSNVTAPVSGAMVDTYMELAEDLATEAVADLSALLPCDPGDIGEQACADAFVDDFGRRAYRLSPVAHKLRTQCVAGSLRGWARSRRLAGGIRLVVSATLQSPYFLYHAEFGGDVDNDLAVVALTDYEVAARLFYFLWNTMPDPELLTAAEDGLLGDRSALREQAERMLVDPRAADALRSFHLQWLGVAELETVEKDAGVFPGFTPSVRASMMKETGTFADYVIRFNDAKLIGRRRRWRRGTVGGPSTL